MSYNVSWMKLLIGLQVLLHSCQCYIQQQPSINPEFHSAQDYFRGNGNWFESKRFQQPRGNLGYENRDVQFDDADRFRNRNQIIFPPPPQIKPRFELNDRIRERPRTIARVFRRKPVIERELTNIRVNGEKVRVHRVPEDGVMPRGAVLLGLEELNNIGEPIKVFISPFVHGNNDKLQSTINDITIDIANKKDKLKSVPKMTRITQPSPAQYSQLDPTYHVEARTSNPLRPLPKPFPDFTTTTDNPNSILSHFARGAVERRQSPESSRTARVLEISNHLTYDKPAFTRHHQQVSDQLPNIPITNFSCSRQLGPGYYADTEMGCKVFHTCDRDKRKNSFFCPKGTIFNQVVLVCDWEQNVECAESELFYNKNIATYTQTNSLTV